MSDQQVKRMPWLVLFLLLFLAFCLAGLAVWLYPVPIGPRVSTRGMQLKTQCLSISTVLAGMVEMYNLDHPDQPMKTLDIPKLNEKYAELKAMSEGFVPGCRFVGEQLDQDPRAIHCVLHGNREQPTAETKLILEKDEVLWRKIRIKTWLLGFLFNL